MKNQIKKIVNWVGKILMVLAFVFLAQKLWSYREDLKIDLDSKKVFMLVACCILYMGTVYMCPIIYKTLLYVTTQKKLSYMQVANTYCRSNILKYLPGNVMQYVGRNQIAIEEELPHGKVALATLLEIGIVIVSAILVATMFSWTYAVEWINKFVNINPLVLLIGAVIVILSCIIVFILFRNKLQEYLRGILIKENITKIIGLILYHALILMLSGIVYFLVMAVLQVNMAPANYLVGIGLYALAFVLGYVTPGVPGGIGIRESILVYFFSAFMLEAQVLTGALLFRIVSVIGDFLAWILITIWVKKVRVDRSNAE